MRIALVEGNLTGHRPVYLRHLLDWLPPDLAIELHAPAGWLDHAAFAGLAASRLAQIRMVELPRQTNDEPHGALAVLRHHLSKARSLRRHLRRCGIGRGDVVAIPYADDLYAGLALHVGRWFGGAKVVTVGMRNDLHLSAGSVLAGGRHPPGALQAWLQRRFLSARDLHRHWSNQLPFAEWSARHFDGRVGFLGDPAPAPCTADRETCCTALGLDPGQHHVLCFGNLTPRKGLARLLRLAARSDWPERTRAVLVGNCDGEAQAALDAATGTTRSRLVLRDGFVPIDDEPVWFAAADLVWLAYEGHPFMSGCLVSAGLARRPVAACRNGLIGWYASRFGLGFLVPEDDAAAVAALAAHSDGTWQAPAVQPFIEHLPERFAARFWGSVRTACA